MKKKYVFLGDTDSINIELISKSHGFLKNKVQYILIGSIEELEKYLKKINSKLEINEIINPFNFKEFKSHNLNIYNIESSSKEISENLINQIDISNFLANKTKIDLVTMPINKYSLKKTLTFNGLTEHLGKINNRKTAMLMKGNIFSIIPITTHINIKNVHKYLNQNKLDTFIKFIINQIEKKKYDLKFKKLKFLCYNPHCGEESLLGNEDRTIFKTIEKFKKIKGPFPADSAFTNNNLDTLFFSMYHDQALIPFKILNKRSMNLTLGLNYRRISPAHGTAKDIKYQNLADNLSYIECMLC